jgi:8-oxo-dGTP diphosphatase
MQPTYIRKVALALFKDKKIIMLRNSDINGVFYFAGGTVEPGETDIECLTREIREELQVEVQEDSLVFLNEFEAPAHGRENTIVNIRMYTGTVIGTPHIDQEIAELTYFDSSVDPKYLSVIAIEQAFPWLKEHGYIN